MAGLKYSQAQVRVEFCDEDDQVLQTEATEWFSGTDREGWVKLDIGPANPADALHRSRAHRAARRARRARRPQRDGFARRRVDGPARRSMTVTTGSPCNVYTSKDDIEITCQLSGILDSDPDILFELLDASSQRLEGSHVQLEGRLITERRSKASEFVGVTETERAAYAGSTTWRPPIAKHGLLQGQASRCRIRAASSTAAW